MSADVVEARAEIIERDVATLGEFGSWLEASAARAAAALERYVPEPIADEDGYKRATKERAAVRKVRAGIDDERKVRLREVEDALRALKEQVKQVTGPLDEADREYKRLMDEYEAQRRRERAAMLAREYEDMAPALAEMLPYERMAAIADPEGRWLLRSVGDQTAVDLMAAAAQRVVADYETVAALDMTDEERTAVRAEFFQTLDLPAAIRHAQEAREERERIAAFEAARRAPEPEPEPEPAPEPDKPMSSIEWVAEQIRREDPDARVSVRGGTVFVSSPRRTAPEPEQAGECPPWAVVAYVTDANRAGLVAWCKENGIRGRAVATHGRPLVIRRWDE